MKKISILVAGLVLSGCAIGINHNVANINGKNYLIETKNYTVPILPVYQWSDKSTFTSLDGDIDAQIVSDKVAEIVKDCGIKARKQTTAHDYNYEQFFNCVNQAAK